VRRARFYIRESVRVEDKRDDDGQCNNCPDGNPRSPPRFTVNQVTWLVALSVLTCDPSVLELAVAASESHVLTAGATGI
jgi:hypothetical protein